MCMSKGVPKKPEFGPCQEQHGLSQIPSQVPLNLNDPKTLREVMDLICFAALMAPLASLVSNLVKAYSNSTTAATLP